MSMTMSGPVDPAALRALPTSECALLLLRALRGAQTLNSNTSFRGAEQAYKHNNEPDVVLLLDRLADAWAWLEAHGLIGPDPGKGSGSGLGLQRLTSRGREVADDSNNVAALQAETRLVMSLHPALESKIRPIFALGDYETAAFSAMKAVEVRVRDLAGLSKSLLGTALMQQAFKVDGGALSDPEAVPGEQVATMQLFAGAIGAFKNPASHRTVSYDDPTEAAEIVLLSDLLMRLLDRVDRRLGGS